MSALPAVNRTGRKTSVVRSCISPSTYEIYKAAAWWAGEGSVSSKDGHLSVNVSQKETDVLKWFVDRFGGSVSDRKKGAKPHLDPVNSWHIHGPRARGFLMTIYSCITESPRRQKQIVLALRATSQIKKRGVQPKDVCGKGHWKEIGEECRVCANQSQRIRRRNTTAGEIHRNKEYERYWRNPDKYRTIAREYRQKKLGDLK